jgi:hypothetical protein
MNYFEDMVKSEGDRRKYFKDVEGWSVAKKFTSQDRPPYF